MKSKFIKLLSTVIIVATLASLSGCDFFDPNGKGPSSGGILEPPPDNFCYSITTDKAEYGYGDEIELTAAIQINPSWLYKNSIVGPATLTVYLEKSSEFEILGDERYVFEDVIVSDHFCLEKDEKLEAKFKVKINEENYDIGLFKIKIELSKSFLPERVARVKGEINLYYILDSQGIIVQQIPASNSHADGYHDSHSLYDAYSHKDELIAASYNREYESGVSVEELIDRYYNMQNYVYYYKSQSNEECYLTYISSGVRFKIYVPKDNEYAKLYEELPFADGAKDEAEKEYLEKLLSFALENGAIAEKEYNAEILRISGGEENVENGNSSPKISRFYGEPTELWKMQDELVFTVPTGDDFYNRVIYVEE